MNSQIKQKQNMNNKKNKNRNRGTPKKEFTLTVPRQVTTIIPDRFRTTLRFWTSKSISIATDNFHAFRFRPTGAQNPDPLVTQSMLGFSQLAALYNSYRVTSSNAKLETVCTGLVPITSTLVPTNTDPGTSPTADYVVASRLQAFAKSKTGALVGGPIATLTNSMATQRMFGSKMVLYDDNFASLVNTIPNNNWYWVCTFYAASTSADAIIINFFYDVEIEYYDRANLAESA